MSPLIPRFISAVLLIAYATYLPENGIAYMEFTTSVMFAVEDNSLHNAVDTSRNSLDDVMSPPVSTSLPLSRHTQTTGSCRVICGCSASRSSGRRRVRSLVIG